MKKKLLILLLSFFAFLTLVSSIYFLYQFYSWLFFDYSHSADKVLINLLMLLIFTGVSCVLAVEVDLESGIKW